MRSQPGPGSELAGAAINTSGRLVVRASKVGADTALAQIARLVEQAQAGKASVQRLADRISAIFVPIVLAISLFCCVIMAPQFQQLLLGFTATLSGESILLRALAIAAMTPVTLMLLSRARFSQDQVQPRAYLAGIGLVGGRGLFREHLGLRFEHVGLAGHGAQTDSACS